MAKVVFTKNLREHIACPETSAPGATVREVLDAVFASNDLLRGYVVDERGALRQHMNVFVDGANVRDRVKLSDPVETDSEIYVMQALSGG
ncbi:MAG: MoaD/ThiS family protein [Planctomycetota bacterium]|nr:MoaD/ThiS family protein [Planctomycetota bacterium]